MRSDATTASYEGENSRRNERAANLKRETTKCVVSHQTPEFIVLFRLVL
jgi:hypothetical protein